MITRNKSTFMPHKCFQTTLLCPIFRMCLTFSFLEGQMHLYPFFYFHFSITQFIFCNIFKMRLKTLVTKYTDILIFIFAHIIYHQRCRTKTRKYILWDQITFVVKRNIKLLIMKHRYCT